MNEEEKEHLFKYLEESGLPAVKAALASGIWTTHKRIYVLGWILTKEQEYQALKENKEIDFKNTSNKIARSAKNASWWSVGISIVSLIIAGLALYYSLK
jgi:hypothetical protein